MCKDKIINKVRALLNKNQDNGATEAEAISALIKATQLMKEYYISELDLKDPYVIEKCILFEVPLVKSGYDLNMFLSELEKLFDCKIFYTSKTVTFFGFKEDTELCSYFYNLIAKTALKEKDLFVKRHKEEYPIKKVHGRSLAASFIKGFLYEICIKMNEMYKDKKSNLPKGSGLVLAKKENRVESQFNDLNFKFKKSYSNIKITDYDGFGEGQEKGSKFHLNQAIQGNEDQRTLLIESTNG